MFRREGKRFHSSLSFPTATVVEAAFFLNLFSPICQKKGHNLETEPFIKKLAFSGKFVESLPFYLRNALPPPLSPFFSPLVSFSRVLEAEGERAPSFLLRPGNKSEICTNLRSVFSQISSPFPLSRQFEKGGEQRTHRVWFGIFFTWLAFGFPYRANESTTCTYTKGPVYLSHQVPPQKNDTSTPQLSFKVAFSIFFKRANCYLWETERRGKSFVRKAYGAITRCVFGSAVSHTNSESAVPE